MLPLELTSNEINLLLVGEEEQPGLLRAYRELVDALSAADTTEQRRALERYRLKVDDTAQALWQRLMGPICERLETLNLRVGSPVLIVPHGSLGLLPLHAASDGGQAFVQRHTLRFAPSLTVLAHIAARARATEAPPRLLAISDPRGDLRFARLECAQIARLFGTGSAQVLTGEAATPAALTRDVRGATHVHFACHGFFSWRDAKRSALALAGDATFDVAEFMSPRVDLDATRLVTLSACESGLSDYARLPDEYLGLPAALLLAGASTVVSTLWAVQDRSTSLLMSEFYRRLLSGDAPAEALAAAQRWLASLSLRELTSWVERARDQLRDADSAQVLAAWSADLARMRGTPPATRPYASPYYWAAFTVVGAA
ncbi:MAG TPA: CHAT domain-containing protein [Burkholderiales bacterium]|nr:CHAT domain-containing protein [Burkholderiales bacterium]